jgi:hypothetical protein
MVPTSRWVRPGAKAKAAIPEKMAKRITPLFGHEINGLLMSRSFAEQCRQVPP